MLKPRFDRARDRAANIGEIKRLSDLTPLEFQLLGVISAASHLNGSHYVAGWDIGKLMGKSPGWLDCICGPNEGDDAMDRLIAAGLVEELEDLNCRYRLTRDAPTLQNTPSVS